MEGRGAIHMKGSNTLPIAMSELWQHIFSPLDFEGVLAARAVSGDWNKLEGAISSYETAPSSIDKKDKINIINI
ncbi:MAG: hypothetical protein ACYC2U_06275 [Candidatus Amoebophilus sp.]